MLLAECGGRRRGRGEGGCLGVGLQLGRHRGGLSKVESKGDVLFLCGEPPDESLAWLVNMDVVLKDIPWGDLDLLHGEKEARMSLS